MVLSDALVKRLVLVFAAAVSGVAATVAGTAVAFVAATTAATATTIGHEAVLSVAGHASLVLVGGHLLVKNSCQLSTLAAALRLDFGIDLS